MVSAVSISCPFKEAAYAYTIVMDRTHTAYSYEYQALQVATESEVHVYQEH
jgi:hypothetical protein